jgi:hypothetical protein
MKTLISIVLLVMSASAAADYLPTIECHAVAIQGPEGQVPSAQARLTNLMWANANSPTGLAILDWVFFRTTNSPDQLDFKILDETGTTAMSGSLKRGENSGFDDQRPGVGSLAGKILISHVEVSCN